MARLILPSRFADKAQLSKKMIAKHTADDTDSILTAFYAENEIAIGDDTETVEQAETVHTTFEQNGRDAEKLIIERDRVFDPIFAQHRRMVQHLKTFYSKNIGKLGDWGVNISGRKIIYPTHVVDKMDAVTTFIDKHQTYASGTSPLTAFLGEATNSDINMATNETNTAAAKENHDNAEALNMTKETNRAERDLLMQVPIKNITLTGNFLTKHFGANPNKAGDWGFTVDTSPQGTRIRSGFVNIGSDKVVSNLAVGGTLSNISEFNVLVFKGKTATGTPVTLAPGKLLLITKGYGTVVIRNPNADTKALYQGVFNR